MGDNDPSSPHAKRQRLIAGQLYDGKHDFEQRNIVFSPQYPGRVFKLMEVPSDLVKSVEAGEELSIVGNKTAEAVLCSSSKTYGMKRVEQSNCVFFVPPSTTGEFSITASSSDYYEVSATLPRLESLKSLLEAGSLYPGSSATAESSSHTLSLSDLLQNVQASKHELVARLRQLGAFELAGRVRTPAKGVLSEHRKALLETIITQGWVTATGVCEVDEALCLSALQASSFEADPVLLQCVLRGLSSEEAGVVSGQLPQYNVTPTHWTLDSSKLKVASAQMLFEEEKLKSKVVRLSVADFLLEWRLRTPGMRLQDEVSPEDMALLRGLAVSIDDQQLHYLPSEELQALDAKARFAALFGVKSTYSLEELLPYLEGLWGPAAGTGAPKTQQDLLTLHTRRSDTSDVLYSAK